MANDIKLAASEDNPAEKKCGRKLGGQLITTPALSGKIPPLPSEIEQQADREWKFKRALRLHF